jgi:hypothetical protein
MASKDHRESVARTVVVLRAVRDDLNANLKKNITLKTAVDVCQDYLLRTDGPAPEFPEDVHVDASTVRNAIVSLDCVQSRVSDNERGALAEARDILDDYQEAMADA